MRRRRAGRLRRLAERIVLGVAMTVLAALVERRLRKAFARTGAPRRRRRQGPGIRVR